MPLPILEKTWVIDVANMSDATASIQNRNAWLYMKNYLVANMPGCTVAGSGVSTGAGAAMDGVDRWATINDVVSSTGNHSWLVLQFANIGNMQICFDLNATASSLSNAIKLVSINGFTGGAINARPTATDQIDISAGFSQLWPGSSGLTSHIYYSTDGEQVRVIPKFTAGSACGGFILGKAHDPVPGWTRPYFTVSINPIALAVWTHAIHMDTATYVKTWAPGSTPCGCHLTGEMSQANSITEIQTVANEISGEWPMSPMGLYGVTAGGRGRHGRIPDMWWGSVGVNALDTYPGDPSKLFIQRDHMIHPWNGTAT